jgi:hypothetical protein
MFLPTSTQHAQSVCVRVCARARVLSLSLLLKSTLSWAIYHGAQVQAIVGCVIFASFMSEVVHSQIGESLRVCVLRTCDRLTQARE